MEITSVIDQYGAGPRLLREAVAGMTREQVLARPIAGKWSTLEVVCHIADFEIVYADRFKRVIAEEGPTLFGGDETLFARRLAYHSRQFEEELKLIEACRESTSRILRTLKDEDFQRIGKHSEAGPLTLLQFLERAAEHIPHHVQFIKEKRKALGV
jgi:uncharacterized damage-inducible protein DinB